MKTPPTIETVATPVAFKNAQKPQWLGMWQHRVAAQPRLPGITFIEMLVVLIILALLAGIVGTQFIGEAEKARAQTTRVQISNLKSALQLYQLHNSMVPTSEQGLEALINKPVVGRAPRNWQGPYITSGQVPTDGWDAPFVYISDGRTYTIISLGADGQEGGIELDADISSNE